ncbi:MAG TPA: hypothetical protein VEL74_21575 [Thermoanaerobaculia bacterium]|nr:hypothetical protein [Thermoanaerobaculia bacterium]
MLWAGVMAGPLAWALHQQVSYMLVPTACAKGTEGMLHLVTLAALLMAAAGALISWRSWKRLPEGSTEMGDAQDTRRRFMALWGLVLSLAFSLVIVAGEIPNWFLGACD